MLTHSLKACVFKIITKTKSLECEKRLPYIILTVWTSNQHWWGQYPFCSDGQLNLNFMYFVSTIIKSYQHILTPHLMPTSVIVLNYDFHLRLSLQLRIRSCPSFMGVGINKKKCGWVHVSLQTITVHVTCTKSHTSDVELIDSVLFLILAYYSLLLSLLSLFPKTDSQVSRMAWSPVSIKRCQRFLLVFI